MPCHCFTCNQLPGSQAHRVLHICPGNRPEKHVSEGRLVLQGQKRRWIGTDLAANSADFSSTDRSFHSQGSHGLMPSVFDFNNIPCLQLFGACNFSELGGWSTNTACSGNRFSKALNMLNELEMMKIWGSTSRMGRRGLPLDMAQSSPGHDSHTAASPTWHSQLGLSENWLCHGP